LKFPPLTTAKNVFPFFHYIHHSNGRHPIIDWDYGYLDFAPEAYEYNRSLLLHSHLYHRDQFKFRLEVNKNRFQSPITTDIFGKKHLAMSTTIMLDPGPMIKSAVELQISSCETTVITPNTFTAHAEQEPVLLKRKTHLNPCPFSGEDFDVTISETNSISIMAHLPVIINLEILTPIILSSLSNSEKMNRIKSILRQIASRQIYIPVLSSNILSSFSLNLKDIEKHFKSSPSAGVVSFSSKVSTKRDCRRILLISHEDSFTGAPIYLAQLANQLEQHGIEIHIISLRPEWRKGVFTNFSKKLSYLEDYKFQKNSNSPVMNNWLLTEMGDKAIKKIVNDFEPDLILSNTLNSSDTIRIAQIYDIPSVLYVHEAWDFGGSNWETKDVFQMRAKEAFEAANLVLFGSRATEIHWRTSGLAINGLTVPSYRSVKAPREREEIRERARYRFGFSNENQIFLCVATFEPRKRIEDIVFAFDSLKIQSIRLILVGVDLGIESSQLSDMVRNDSRIILVKPTGNLVDFYAAADCFVFASIEETMPLVLQEAALWNLPRIIATYRGIEELVPSDEYAFLFPTRDVRALASRMEEFLSSQEKAQGMALRAFAHQIKLVEDRDSNFLESVLNLLEFRTSISPIGWVNGEN
jgi:glycosyltransferase involved in cell wall biosynthesis